MSQIFNEILSLVENECKEGTYLQIANLLKNLYAQNPDERLPNHDRLWVGVHRDETIQTCSIISCSNLFLTNNNSDISIRSYIPSTTNIYDDSLLIDIVPSTYFRLGLYQMSAKIFNDTLFSSGFSPSTINFFCSQSCIKQYVDQEVRNQQKLLIKLPPIDQNFIDFMKQRHSKLARCMGILNRKTRIKKEKLSDMCLEQIINQMVNVYDFSTQNTDQICEEKRYINEIGENFTNYDEQKYKKNNFYKTNRDFIIYNIADGFLDKDKHFNYYKNNINISEVSHEKQLLGKKMYLNINSFLSTIIYIQNRKNSGTNCWADDNWLYEIFTIIRYFTNYISLSNVEDIIYSQEENNTLSFYEDYKVRALKLLRLWMYNMGFDIQKDMRGRNIRKIIRDHDKNLLHVE